MLIIGVSYDYHGLTTEFFFREWCFEYWGDDWRYLFLGLPSSKLIHNYGKSQCLMGKSTINIINGHINNSYVSLPAANIHHEIGGWPRARGKQLKSQMCHLMSLLRSLDVKWHLLVYIYIYSYIYITRGLPHFWQITWWEIGLEFSRQTISCFFIPLILHKGQVPWYTSDLNQLHRKINMEPEQMAPRRGFYYWMWPNCWVPCQI